MNSIKTTYLAIIITSVITLIFALATNWDLPTFYWSLLIQSVVYSSIEGFTIWKDKDGNVPEELIDESLISIHDSPYKQKQRMAVVHFVAHGILHGLFGIFFYTQFGLPTAMLVIISLCIPLVGNLTMWLKDGKTYQANTTLGQLLIAPLIRLLPIYVLAKLLVPLDSNIGLTIFMVAKTALDMYLANTKTPPEAK